MHFQTTKFQGDGSCLKQEHKLTQREHKPGALAQVSHGSSFGTASSSDNSDFSETVNPDVSVVLRLECVSAKTLKKIFVGFSVLRWTMTSAWVAAFASIYIERNGGKTRFALLVASAAVGAVCTATLCITLTRFWVAVLKATRAQQKWTQRRSRLVTLTMLELVCLVLSNFMLTVSSGYGSTRGSCHLFTNFCKWSEYVQWSGWNAVLFLHLILIDGATAWTGPDGKRWRRFLVHRTAWLKEHESYSLVLDAPWLIHLPKVFPWLMLQGMLTLQLANALSGGAYHSLSHVDCVQRPDLVCHQTYTYISAVIAQAVALGIFFCWHIMLLKFGVQDAQQMPYRSFRLGRALTRLRTSKVLGLGHSSLIDAGLLLATVLRPTKCSSCLGSWMQLAANLQAISMTISSSMLLQPCSATGSDTLVMQQWLQHFAWTEKSQSGRSEKRNSMLKLHNRQLLEQEPLFCFETAVKLLYWCGFAYEYDEGHTEEKLSETTAMQLYNLEKLHMLRDPVTNTKCLVAWGSDTLLVSFRGTANRQNVTHDIKAWLVPLGNEAESVGAAVHSGFKASWHSGLRQLVNDLVSGMMASDSNQAGNMRVLITGHSLGGVMAVLAAYDIAELFPWLSVQVYTVGAPRPGNRAFAKQYEAKVPDTWHVINDKDPVPVVGKFGSMYARPGHRVLIDPKGNMIVRPTPLDAKLAQACGRLKAHLLNAYRASLVQVIKEQLDRPKFEDGLEGILELAKSVSLTDTLLAADLNIVGESTSLAGNVAQQTVSSILLPESV
ncbi:hypothetical protein WJX77_009083 [Trebouxia sp. C0004]